MINIINNVKDFFKEIKFNEETHTYTKDKKRLTPVSYVLKNFVEEFDSDKMSALVAVRSEERRVGEGGGKRGGETAAPGRSKCVKTRSCWL